MNTEQDRINALEMKLTYQQETIDSLNETVTEQWAEIEKLKKLMPALTERLFKLEDNAPQAPEAPPPHY